MMIFGIGTKSTYEYQAIWWWYQIIEMIARKGFKKEKDEQEWGWVGLGWVGL